MLTLHVLVHPEQGKEEREGGMEQLEKKGIKGGFFTAGFFCLLFGTCNGPEYKAISSKYLNEREEEKNKRGFLINIE